MTISQEDAILIKNLYLSKQYGACMKAVEWIAWQGLETWKHWQSAYENLQKKVQLSGKQAVIDRVQHVAVEDLMLRHQDKPKAPSAREISHEIAILCSSVHRIIHCDLQLKCFNRRRAQLLSEANRISHLTHF